MIQHETKCKTCGAHNSPDAGAGCKPDGLLLGGLLWLGFLGRNGGVDPSNGGGIHIFPGFDPDGDGNGGTKPGEGGNESGGNTGTGGDQNQGGNESGGGTDTTPQWPAEGASTTDESTGNSYTMKEGNVVELTSLGAKVTSFVVSDDGKVTINGTEYKIASFASGAFENAENLTSVTVPTSLCDDKENNKYSGLNTALNNCPTSSLRVTINSSSSGNTTIPGNAFNGNSKITAVSIENGITTIGTAAFKECINLTMVYIPSSVVNIEINAFAGKGMTRYVKDVYYGGSEENWQEWEDKYSESSIWAMLEVPGIWPTPKEYNAAGLPEANGLNDALTSLNSLFSVL